MNDLGTSKVLNEPKTDFEKLLLAQRYIKQLKKDIEQLQREEDDITRPYKIEIGKLTSYIEELEDENKKLKHIKSIKEPVAPIVKEIVKIEMCKMTLEEKLHFREKGYLQEIKRLNERLDNKEDSRVQQKRKKLKMEFDAQRAELLNTIFQLRKQLDERGN